MNILVTGGAGFIGFHVAKALLERGDQVIIVDNLNDYYDVNIKKARIEQLKAFNNLKIIEGDIYDYKLMETIFRLNNFDKVCHLAAQAGVKYSLENPTAYVNSNTIGTCNILELCRKFKVKDLVFASSSSVYGENKKFPYIESDTPDYQVSFYGITKRVGEVFARTYHEVHGLNCIGLRYFTCYGPFGRPDMAYFHFTKSILNGGEVEVFGSEVKRDFTYISDIVAGTIAAIDNPYPFEIFNLARGEQTDFNQIVSEIENNLGIKANKKIIPLIPGVMKETYGDISKARKMLGYNPKVSIKEGIKNFIDWYTSYYDIKK